MKIFICKCWHFVIQLFRCKLAAWPCWYRHLLQRPKNDDNNYCKGYKVMTQVQLSILAFPSRSLCSTLLSAQVNLLAYFQCLMELLPENQRLEIGGIKYDNQPMPWTTSPKQPYGLCEDFSLLGQIYSLLLIFDFFCGQSELMYQHAANIACYLWNVVWLTPIPQ